MTYKLHVLGNYTTEHKIMKKIIMSQKNAVIPK